MEKLNRQQLVELIEHLRRGDAENEDIEDQWVAQIHASVADPNIIDYIFHDFSTPPLTSEQIVDKALSYKSIALGGPE